MKNEKFSVDILIILVFVICFCVLGCEIYINYYDFLLANDLVHKNVTEFMLRILRIYPLNENPVMVRLCCALIIAFSSLGFQIKIKPEEDNKQTLYAIMVFVFLGAFILTPLFNVHFYLNLRFTFTFFTAFFWAFTNLRKHFNYFGHQDEFNEKNQVFKQENLVKN